MSKVSDIVPGTNLMCLFKGEPKTGKKNAWGSFPEPIYCYDLDMRMTSLATDPVLSKRDIEYDTYTDFTKLWDKLEKMQEDCPYKTVTLHSITSLARMLQNFIFSNRGANVEMSRATDRQRDGKGNLTVGGIPIMGIADYNGESSGLNQVLTKLRIIRNKGVNVVLVAHVITTEVQTLDGTYRTSRRILTGGNKVAAEIPSYFDEVYHFYVKTAGGLAENAERHFVAATQATGTDFAGTSLRGIPPEIDFTDKLFYEELSKYFPKKDVDKTLSEILQEYP